MGNPTRRTILASAATLPALAVLSTPALSALSSDPAVLAWVRWDAAHAALSAAPEGDDDSEMSDMFAAERALADAPALTLAGALAKLDMSLVDHHADDDFSQSDKRALLSLAAALVDQGAALPGGPVFVRSRAKIRKASGNLPAETVIAGIFLADGGRA